MMFSGIVMSRHVFAFLPIGGGVMLARRLHIIGSYWGILLMILHLGMHIKIFAGMIKKRVRIPTPAVFVPSLVIAAYGIYAFIKRDFFTYMLLQSEFVFLDYDEPKMLFYLDYISIMVMSIFIGHCLAKIFDKNKHIRKNKNINAQHRNTPCCVFIFEQVFVPVKIEYMMYDKKQKHSGTHPFVSNIPPKLIAHKKQHRKCHKNVNYNFCSKLRFHFFHRLYQYPRPFSHSAMSPAELGVLFLETLKPSVIIFAFGSAETIELIVPEKPLPP